MNPRFSMNVVTTWNWDLGTCVETYARLGIPAIGLTRASVAQFGPDKAPKRIRDAGLKVASYSGITSRGVGSDNSKAALDDACKQMDIGAALEATCLYTISGPRDGLSWEEAGKRFQQGVAALVPQ